MVDADSGCDNLIVGRPTVALLRPVGLFWRDALKLRACIPQGLQRHGMKDSHSADSMISDLKTMVLTGISTMPCRSCLTVQLESFGTCGLRRGLRIRVSRYIRTISVTSIAP